MLINVVRNVTKYKSKRYVQWAATIPLIDVNSCYILVPFNFESINDSNRVRNIIPRDCFQKLSGKCADIDYLPATLGGNISHQIPL